MINAKVSDINERNWVEDHYFANGDPLKPLQPKYNDLNSGLNTINTLKEQVLLRVYEETNITIGKLKLSKAIMV